MDREILFRGMDDNKRLIQGYFFQIWEDCFILWGTTNGVPNMTKVDPATVGQFTGLCDKNGVKIFEGDILYKEGHWTFYVGYEMGAFRAIPLEPVQKLNWPHCTLEEFLRVGMGDCKGFTVIGNIHYTPNVAKEEAE